MMVADAAENAYWKNQYAGSFTSMKKKLAVPMNVFCGESGCDPPNANPYPTQNHAIDAPQASSRFFRSVFCTFFFRTAPAQSMANPACMKNTNAPASTRPMVRANIRDPTSGPIAFAKQLKTTVTFWSTLVRL
jgi:hypothetical protein